MITFPEYESFDALGLAGLVKQGVITPAELLTAAIERIEAKNPQLNAVIHKMYDQAHAAMQTLPDGLFQGVPFLLKDLLAQYADAPLSLGSYFTQDYRSTVDTELVRLYKQAGLVILGKTNTPEFGLSPVTEPVRFGPTLNPWNTQHTTGGSSGGSAAAVAAGIVPAAHGGDGGGSIRIPAAYCGVFGLKPSRGRTPVGPNYSRVWLGMVVEHVLTRSVRDSAALLDVTSMPELGSPISLAKPTKSFLSYLDTPPPPLRIAMIEQPFFTANVHPDYLNALQQTAKLCQELGHKVELVSIPINSIETAYAYLVIIAAEMAAGVRWLTQLLGRKPGHHDLEAPTAVLTQVGEHFSAADMATAIYTLDSVACQMAKFFENYDVIMTPTMAMPPPKIGELKPDFVEQSVLEFLRTLPYEPALRRLIRQVARKQMGYTPFTPLFNISGQPAMSVPLYQDSQGLPIGIQFAGPMESEGLLLQLAHQLEQANGFIKSPSLSKGI